MPRSTISPKYSVDIRALVTSSTIYVGEISIQQPWKSFTPFPQHQLLSIFYIWFNQLNHLKFIHTGHFFKHIHYAPLLTMSNVTSPRATTPESAKIHPPDDGHTTPSSAQWEEKRILESDNSPSSQRSSPSINQSQSLSVPETSNEDGSQRDISVSIVLLPSEHIRKEESFQIQEMIVVPLIPSYVAKLLSLKTQYSSIRASPHLDAINLHSESAFCIKGSRMEGTAAAFNTPLHGITIVIPRLSDPYLGAFVIFRGRHSRFPFADHDESGVDLPKLGGLFLEMQD
jgi:hypothetical protein